MEVGQGPTGAVAPKKKIINVDFFTSLGCIDNEALVVPESIVFIIRNFMHFSEWPVTSKAINIT
jgi:hypothetical protein